MACWGIGPAGGWALNETSAALRHDAADRPLGIGVPADRVRKRAAEDHSYFPDKLPIGVQKHDLDHHVFLYLVTRTLPIDFRMFLLRHAELFRTLHTWTVRVLVLRRFWKTTALYKTALRDELWTPLEPHITDRLATYFRERRETGGHMSNPSDEYLVKAFRRYGAGRFASLYRAWRRMGDPILRAAPSTILRDARERGWGACEIHPLRGQYLQLTGLIDRADRATRGAKRIRGQVGPLAADSSLDSFSPPFYEAMTLNATQASTLQHIAESRPSRGRRSVPAASVRLVHRPVSQRWCEDPGALA